MKKLREIYDDISKFNPLSWTLDLSPLYDSIIAKLNGEPEPQNVKKILTKGEEYINGAIKVSKLDLFEGEIIVPQKDHIYGYQDLTFDEFCSYIHWRTLIRNKKTYNIPAGFLALHLIEIVNFIEVETYSDGLELLKKLKQLSEHESNNSRQVDKAMEEFVIVYGSVADVREYCDLSQFDYIFEDILIYKRKHPFLLSYLSTNFYSQLKKSKLWENESRILEENFPEYFYSIADYFENQNVSFLELYLGKPKYFSLPKVYIKHILDEKIIAKEVVCDEISLIKVSTDAVQRIATGYTDGTDEDMGHLFVRQYIIKFILRLFEKGMRELLGYPKIKAEMKITNELALKNKIPSELFALINTEEFKQIANHVQCK